MRQLQPGDVLVTSEDRCLMGEMFIDALESDEWYLRRSSQRAQLSAGSVVLVLAVERKIINDIVTALVTCSLGVGWLYIDTVAARLELRPSP